MKSTPPDEARNPICHDDRLQTHIRPGTPHRTRQSHGRADDATKWPRQKRLWLGNRPASKSPPMWKSHGRDWQNAGADDTPCWEERSMPCAHSKREEFQPRIAGDALRNERDNKAFQKQTLKTRRNTGPAPAAKKP